MLPCVLLSVICSIYITPHAFASLSVHQSDPINVPADGLQAEGSGDGQRAISIYLSDLLSTPNRRDLWLRIASLEHQLKNKRLAIDAYKHAILLQPNDPVVHKTLSEIYAELNQPAEALVEINAAVSLKPNDIDYLMARANIANWNKNVDLALDSNQRILVLTARGNTKIMLETLTQIGSIQSQLHHYPEAIEAYTQAIKLNPTVSALHQALSQVYASDDDPDHALIAIDAALKLEPTNAQYLNAKAVLALWLKNNNLIEPAINSPKNSISPFEQLINQANNAGVLHQYNLAAHFIKKAIILQPNNPVLYKKLSEIYATASNAQRALVAINKAVTLDPTNLTYLRARAKVAAWALDKMQTLDSYQRILHYKPHDEDALLNLAHTLAWQGKTDAAIHAYQQLLALYPQNAEGWIQYAEVLSWTANFIGSLDALQHYKQSKGTTTQYCEVKARVLALVGRFKTALAMNGPLLREKPTDPYLVSTEVAALSRALQINKALYYLKKLGTTPSDDAQVNGLRKLTLTLLRSNVNLEADYTSASDTTRIADFPVSVQYFLSPDTKLLFQGLYERATAAPGSPLEAVNGHTSISDVSAKVGFATQIDALNLKAMLGALSIQNENNHGIYNASLNTNLGQTAQITIEGSHDLYRPYLVPQSPKLISLQIMESRIGTAIQWQPFVQKYLNVAMSYSDLTDNNSYLHVNVWPKSRIYGSEHWLVTVGVDGDFWHYRRRATDGYYSPLHFDGYEGTIELYYAQSENIGYSFSAGFGMQKDETFPHYFYEEDLAMQMFMGIFTDWELQAKGGYTLRENPTGNYNCWSAAIVLTRRF